VSETADRETADRATADRETADTETADTADARDRIDVRLVPLTAEHLDAFGAMADDPEVLRFTRFPDPTPPGFVAEWFARYEQGRADGTREAFAALDGHGEFVGVGLAVDINRDEAQAELGYIVAPAVRGRGVASSLLRQLTDWAFAELGSFRLVLLIDVANVPSQRAAANAGYQLEGVLRSTYVRQGRRSDTAIWSRLKSDPAPSG
jgi:RimJ/RimL family protein N-acetyltransferase